MQALSQWPSFGPVMNWRALVFATVSFAISFAAWGLVGGLAPIFTDLYQLSASQTALLVAVPVLLGSVARLPMGMLTDRYGGRAMFTLLLATSAAAAWVVSLTTSYASLIAAAFFIGLAGSYFQQLAPLPLHLRKQRAVAIRELAPRRRWRGKSPRD